MKRLRNTVLVLAMLVSISMFAHAGGYSRYLNNGFQALFYHSIRIEETFPALNPIGASIQEFEKAVKEGVAVGEAQLMLGMIHQYLGQSMKALQYYSAFAELHPEEKWIHTLIGDLYADIGLDDLALESYHDAVEESEFARAYLGIGSVAYEKGDYEQAREALTKALEGAPEFLEARLVLGKTLYKMNEFDEAIEVLEIAQLQNSRSSEIHYYLGLSYEAAGRHEQAKHAFERVSELTAP